MNLSLYCHVSEAALLAGVTDRQVRNAIKDGRIEATKVGHVRMLLRASAQSFERVRGMGRPKKAKKAAARKKPARQR
jgi:excisionase family DNA binding protein